MQNYHKFAIVGLTIGTIAVVFGIVALTTPIWISVEVGANQDPFVYDLFRRCITKNETIECEKINTFKMPQSLEITGYIILFVGLLIGVASTAVVNRRCIHLVSPFMLLAGSTLILIGLLFYAKHVIEHFGNNIQTKINIGYSMGLMITVCLNGFILTAYFSFTAGYAYHHNRDAIDAY